MQPTNRIGEKRPNVQTTTEQRANGASAQTAKGLETMNSTENNTENSTDAKPQTENTEQPKPQTDKGKSKRKARKASDRKPQFGKAQKAILDTVKCMIALPLLAKSFGGEVQKVDLPRIQSLASDKPKTFRALNSILGSTDRQSPLRLKKSALAAFINVHMSVMPSFGEEMQEALSGKPASTVDKLTLTVALLECMTVTDIRQTWTQYANYMNG